MILVSTDCIRSRTSVEQFLLDGHYVDSNVQRMFGAAQENAMDGAHIAIITPPCHRDVAVRGHAVVCGIEIHPTGAWAPNRAPGM
jgi:hypothetical protein